MLLPTLLGEILLLRLVLANHETLNPEVDSSPIRQPGKLSSMSRALSRELIAGLAIECCLMGQAAIVFERWVFELDASVALLKLSACWLPIFSVSYSH